MDPDGKYSGFSMEGISRTSQKKDKGKLKECLQIPSCKTKLHLSEPGLQSQLDDTNTVLEHEIQPLLGNVPYFLFIVLKSHVRSHHLVLPAKMQKNLPRAAVPVVLTCRNKNWTMNYLGDHSPKMLDSGWRKFFVDNNIKLGDGCIFELVECSNKGAKFRVQILNGEIPPEFLNTAGNTSKAPIELD